MAILSTAEDGVLLDGVDAGRKYKASTEAGWKVHCLETVIFGVYDELDIGIGIAAVPNGTEPFCCELYWL